MRICEMFIKKSHELDVYTYTPGKLLYFLTHPMKYYKRQVSLTGKSHEVWMMMIAVSLVWAGVGEKCEQLNVVLGN